jgi:UPF0716 family protein affecting phage T7 exclusion
LIIREYYIYICMWVDYELGIFKTTAGAVAGGIFGLALFKAGGGWRSASVAAGMGAGIGSTFQRAKQGLQQ